MTPNTGLYTAYNIAARRALFWDATWPFTKGVFVAFCQVRDARRDTMCLHHTRMDRFKIRNHCEPFRTVCSKGDGMIQGWGFQPRVAFKFRPFQSAWGWQSRRYVFREW